jgi:hypothetical protein
MLRSILACHDWCFGNKQKSATNRTREGEDGVGLGRHRLQARRVVVGPHEDFDALDVRVLLHDHVTHALQRGSRHFAVKTHPTD